MMRAVAICQKAGITYRQLDHWTRCGYVHAEDRPAAHPGAGRDFTDTEVEVICKMSVLVGLHMEPAFAAEVARHVVESGNDTCTLRLHGTPRLGLTWLPA